MKLSQTIAVAETAPLFFFGTRRVGGRYYFWSNRSITMPECHGMQIITNFWFWPLPPVYHLANQKEDAAQLTSASNITTSASSLENDLLMRKLKTNAGRRMSPQSNAPSCSQSCLLSPLEGRSAGFAALGTRSTQAPKGTRLSTKLMKATSKNMA